MQDSSDNRWPWQHRHSIPKKVNEVPNQEEVHQYYNRDHQYPWNGVTLSQTIRFRGPEAEAEVRKIKIFWWAEPGDREWSIIEDLECFRQKGRDLLRLNAEYWVKKVIGKYNQCTKMIYLNWPQ